MKIITDDKVYIQYLDAFNLSTIVSFLDISCPPSVANKCYRNEIVVNGDNRYAFIEFHEKEAISFFKKIDCIIDYNDYINKDEEEIIELIKEQIKESQSILDSYQKLDTKKQQKYYHKYHNLYYIKMYKAQSMRELLAFKKGENVYDLPIGNQQVEEKEKKKEIKKNLIKTDHSII